MVTGVLAAPLIVLGPAAARAEPTECTATASGNRTHARCLGGTGLVRAGILCAVKNGEFENDHFGPWVGVGATSTAACLGGGRGIDWWYEIA
jgi:hypothetical protein